MEEFPFADLVEARYQTSLDKLKTALAETDLQKQANSGSYWDKFAAISGKLYLAQHLDQLPTIYKSGPGSLLEKMLADG